MWEIVNTPPGLNPLNPSQCYGCPLGVHWGSKWGQMGAVSVRRGVYESGVYGDVFRVTTFPHLRGNPALVHIYNPFVISAFIDRTDLSISATLGVEWASCTYPGSACTKRKGLWTLPPTTSFELIILSTAVAINIHLWFEIPLFVSHAIGDLEDWEQSMSRSTHWVTDWSTRSTLLYLCTEAYGRNSVRDAHCSRVVMHTSLCMLLSPAWMHACKASSCMSFTTCGLRHGTPGTVHQYTVRECSPSTHGMYRMLKTHAMARCHIAIHASYSSWRFLSVISLSIDRSCTVINASSPASHWMGEVRCIWIRIFNGIRYHVSPASGPPYVTPARTVDTFLREYSTFPYPVLIMPARTYSALVKDDNLQWFFNHHGHNDFSPGYDETSLNITPFSITL